ncbi:hypothetical protein Ahy_B01g056780 [Arachis hypogaea]|uniref:Uncharacterized protein n=1 Tax=Arachis hypogaea TaxID=3818 RepID=A0A445AZM3_ARAHY|nr:hypothetical protein Ahy_B01g056780 [Arachis hypogaea]
MRTLKAPFAVKWLKIIKRASTNQFSVNGKKRVLSILEQYQIKYHNSFSYYLQDKGQAKSTNKNFLKILTNMVTNTHKNWSEYLSFVLWTYKTFSLVYGTEVVLLTKIEVTINREAKLLELQEKKKPTPYEHCIVLDPNHRTIISSINFMYIKKYYPSFRFRS